MQGQLTEISGAMTGGGSRAFQGKMCTDRSKIQECAHSSGTDNVGDHQSLERNVREKEQKLKEIRHEIDSLTTRSEALKIAMKNGAYRKDHLTVGA